MNLLHYKSQVRSPGIVSDRTAKKVNPRELKLAEQLINSASEERFDFASYEDHYTDRLRELIEAKMKGKEVVAPPTQEAVTVINLADAIRQSLKQAKRGKRMPSARRLPEMRRRKS